jgi:hypothetical protein
VLLSAATTACCLQAQQLQLEAWEIVVTHQELVSGIYSKLLAPHGAAGAQSTVAPYVPDMQAAGAAGMKAPGISDAPAAGAAGVQAADATTQAAGANAAAAQPSCCVQPAEPWLQAVCAKVLARYPLLDALDRMDMHVFSFIRHMSLDEYAALWCGHLSELALLVSCGEHADTAAQLVNVCAHLIALGRSALVLNPALPMSMIGYNMIACRHEVRARGSCHVLSSELPGQRCVRSAAVLAATTHL